MQVEENGQGEAVPEVSEEDIAGLKEAMAE